jgi:hypothetical protein
MRAEAGDRPPPAAGRRRQPVDLRVIEDFFVLKG